MPGLFNAPTLATPPSFAYPSDAEGNRLDRERTLFMSDPNKVEQIVAHLSKQYIPLNKREKLTSQNNIAHIEKFIPDDDPRKTVGSQTIAEANVAIASRPDLHPMEVIKTLYDANVASRRKDTFKYLDKAQEGSSWIPFTGKTVGKDVADEPGYAEYKQQKEEYNKTHFTLDEYTAPKDAMMWGAGLAGAQSVGQFIGEKGGTGITSKVARLAGRYLPSAIKGLPGGRLAGLAATAALAIPEFWAFDTARQAVIKAPGIRDMPALPKEVLGFVAGGKAFSMVNKGLTGQIEKYMANRAASQVAAEQVMTDPTVATVLHEAKTKTMTQRALADIDIEMKPSAGGTWAQEGDTIFNESWKAQASPFSEMKAISKVAKPPTVKPSITEEQVDRIIKVAEAGAPMEEATAKVLTQDKLLGTLDAVKQKKLYEGMVTDAADKEAKILRKRLFNDALSQGADPASAAILTQKGLAKMEFDDLLKNINTTGIKHAPDVHAGLVSMGYSDPSNIPIRIGRSLVSRQKAGINEARLAEEKSISEMLHDEAKFGGMTEARMVNPLALEDKYGLQRAASVLKETEKLVPETSKFDVSGGVKTTEKVYHGTYADFEEFDPSKLGSSSGAPSSKEGFFFATNKKVAESYGSDINKKIVGLQKSSDSASKQLKELTGDTETEASYKLFNKQYPKDIEVKVRKLVEKTNAYHDYVGGLENLPSAYEQNLARSGKVKETYLDMNDPYIHDMKGKPFRDESYNNIIKSAKKAGHDSVIIKNTYDGANPVGDLEQTDIHVVFNAKQIKNVLPKNPMFKKGEPSPTATEAEWVDYFRKQKNLTDTPLNYTRTPEPMRKAYNTVATERSEVMYAHKIALETKEAEEAIRLITKTVHEPVEALKAIPSEFVTDTQFKKAMTDLEGKLGKTGPMPASINTAERLSTIKDVATKKGLLKKDLIGDDVGPTAGVTGGAARPKAKVAFEDSAKDLYAKFSSKTISQDNYDDALDELLASHPEGKEWSKLSVAAMIGGGLSALSAILPKDADAAGIPSGVVTNATKEIFGSFKKTAKEMIDSIVKGGYFTPDYVKGSYSFAEKGNSITVKPSMFNVAEKYKKAKLAFQDHLSGNVTAEYIYNARAADGTKLPTNPYIELASRTAIAMANARKALFLTEDVMAQVPGGMSHMKEIREAYKPLVEMEEIGNRISFHNANVDKLEEMIVKMEKKQLKLGGDEAEIFNADIQRMREMQEVSKSEVAKLDFNKEAFDAAWTDISREVAKRFPSSRIALALEGEGMAAADPWVLKYLTEGEKIAVGRLRKLNTDIAGFIKDVGGEPILSKPYMHHANHPDMDFQKLKKELSPFSLDPDNVIPLSKLFHRQYGSKQMMPDTQFIMQQYLPDIFKRVEIMDFWKKGRPDGWYAHKQAVTQLGWKGPMALMENIAKSLKPEEAGMLNDVARKAYAFEAARLIALNPAPGFKHLMKQVVDWANFGFKQTAENMPRAFNLAQKDALATAYESLTGNKVTRDIETNLYRTFTGAGNITAMIQDLNITSVPKGWFETVSRKISEYGGIPINVAERFDRSVGFVGAMEMAAKKGMTAEDAIYGIYDTILKTSFLSGTQNPAWLRNPKIRALFMFQGTPFKIAEQRVLLANRGIEGIKGATLEYWNQLQGIRKMVGEGEREFKFALIKDALEKEKDVFGIPYAHQMMRQILMLGTVIYGGKKLFDADLTSHAFHLPGVTLDEGKPIISVNPIMKAAIGAGKVQKDDEFWTSAFIKKWFNSGPMPASVAKGMRLSNDDIPNIYKDNKFRYFFGIPATKED